MEIFLVTVMVRTVGLLEEEAEDIKMVVVQVLMAVKEEALIVLQKIRLPPECLILEEAELVPQDLALMTEGMGVPV
jgi:hypothetical protein